MTIFFTKRPERVLILGVGFYEPPELFFSLFSHEREKAIRQNLCGIYSELAVRAYLSTIGINFRANIEAQTLSFDPSNLTAPDFFVEWPRASGKWRELEVKSNQTYWNATYFRMLIPTHWHGYGKSDSLVLWTSVDVDSLQVNVHGFNYASSDMLVPNLVAKKTCVHNFQLRADVPIRDLATETQDSTPDPHRGFPFLKDGLWTVRQDGAELVVASP